MATHSSTLAWKIPWTEESGRLQSMGSQRVGHNWATSLHVTWLLQITGREHSPTPQQKIALKIYWTCPCPSEQDPVSHSVSLSHQEAFIGLLSYSIRGQRNWNHNHRKLNNLITWTTAFSNSMKLWAMPYRATQDGQVMVENSDKMWSTGEENGKPLQYSCLENPMNSMKMAKRKDTERWTPQVSRCPICC